MVSFTNLAKNKYDIKAPNGSDKPEINVYKNALVLLFVE